MLQSVSPQVTGIQVHANPEETGALIARGTQQFGQGLEQAGKFYGQVAANDANNDFMEKASKIRSGLLALSGREALDALPKAQKDLEDAYQGARGNLWTDESRLNFDSISRRYKSLITGDIADYGANQQKQYAKSVNSSSIEIFKNQAADAEARGDDESLAHALDGLRGAYVKNAQIEMGSDPTAIKEAQLQADRAFVTARVETAIVKDPMRAKTILDANGSALGGTPEYMRLTNQVNEAVKGNLIATLSQGQVPPAESAAPARGAVNEQDAANFVKSTFPGATVTSQQRTPEHNAEVGGVPGSMHISGQAIDFVAPPGTTLAHVQEKLAAAGFPATEVLQEKNGSFHVGWAPKGQGEVQPPNFDYQHADGMIKPGNLDPWHRPVLHNPDGSYSTTSSFSIGEEGGEVLIPSVVNGKRLSQADAIAHYKATGENLGTFSSPEAADKFATSLHNAQASMYDSHGNPLGKSVGVQQPTNDEYLATVRAKAEAVFGKDHPAEVESVVRGVEEAIKRNGMDVAQEMSLSARDTIAFLKAGGDPAQVTLTPEQVRSGMRGIRGDTTADELSAAIDQSKAERQIATASPQQVADILSSHVPQGPAGFRADYGTYGALVKAAEARQVALHGDGTKPGDPGGYVLQAFPDVAQLYNSSLKDPTMFGQYAKRTLAAQTTLGVPENEQRLMPASAMRSMVTSIVTGDPGQILPSLANLKKETGSYWPQFYADMARNGLPSSFQTLAVVGEKDAGVMASAMAYDAGERVKGKPPMAEAMRGITYLDDSGTPKSVTGAVESAMAADKGLNDLRGSYGAFGRAGAESFNGIFDAVRTTALYLYQTRSMTPQQATTMAAGMVTAPFDFVKQPGHPALRLPKGATSDFQSASQWTLDHLQLKDVQPYAASTDENGEVLAEQTPNELREQALQGAKRAFWVATPAGNGSGAVTAMDPQSGYPVMLANGKPLTIPFSRLQALAQESARHQAQQANQRLEELESK